MNTKQPVNILLVDDQPAKLLSYETILADLGENLIRAYSGKEALELLLKNEVAVVLVDVCMPEMDGFELASLIRDHPRYQKTAIILISGVLVEDIDRLKGYGSGAVDYISVPIVPEILRAKVAVFAELYRKTDELERLNQELEQRVAERTAEIEASTERMRLCLTTAGIHGWTFDIAKKEFAWVRPLDGRGEVSQPFSDFLAGVHPDDRADVEKAFERAVGIQCAFYAEFRTEEAGDEQWWLGRGTVIRAASGQPGSIAGININITGRKHAEEERVGLLNKAEEAWREAERANRVKDEFLAILSHELRTPLNAITGWAHMLLAGGVDEKTRTKALETINRNALLQARLIADLLDVSRIVSGKMRLDLRPVALPSVIQAALDAARPAAEARNIRLDAAFPAQVKAITGDPARLQQVVGNLLSNAIKFTPPNGHVQVRLREADSKVELTVEDDGPGIPRDFLPHVFERFRQVDSSTSRAHKGLGLGLAIVRHLVEMHGGSVKAMNRQDRSGAIFSVVLPLVPSPAEEVSGVRIPAPLWPGLGTWAPATSLLKSARILFVDDEADAREVVAAILGRCGAEVMLAASAREAFDLLQRERPDVLLADIEMPGEDGYSLLRKIRSLPFERGGQTPAIALTAHAAAADRVRVLEAGFHTHVPKPVVASELVGVVAALAKADRKAGRDSRQWDSKRKGRGNDNGKREKASPARG